MFNIIKFTNVDLEQERVSYEIEPDRSFQGEVHIVPFHNENYGAVNWMKVFICCEKHNVKVISHGRNNYFPLLSRISHKITTFKMPLDFLFDGRSHGGSNRNAISKLFNCPCPLFIRKFKDLSSFYKFTNQPVDAQEVEKITWEEIEEFMATRTTLLPYNTFSLFNKKCREHDLIICNLGENFPNIHKYLTDNYSDRLKALNDSFNSDLLKSAGNNFMSFQILGSIYNKWKYFATGGAASLFLMLPVNTLFMAERDDTLDHRVMKIKSSINKALFNQKCRFFSTDPCSNRQPLTAKQKNIVNKCFQF